MHKLPTVYLVMVTSVDGVIAKNSKEFISWSSKEDKMFFAKFTKEKGCVIMGENTFNTLKRPFPERTSIVLSLDPDEMKKKYSEYTNVYFIKKETAKEVLEYAKELGFDEVIIGGGSYVNTFFAKENFIDYIYISVEPVIAGKGMNLFNDDLMLQLNLDGIDKLNENTILLKYSVRKN